MSERQSATPEKTEASRAKTQRLIGRLGASVAGGALMAAPVSIIKGLDNAQFEDTLGVNQTTVELTPGHSEIDTGIFGKGYGNTLTEYGVGMDVTMRAPTDLEDVANSNNIDQLIKPYATLLQNPNDTISGYKAAIYDELKHEILDQELKLTALFSTLSFILASVGGNMSPRDRKRYLAATFGSLSVISLYLSNDALHEWQNENAPPAQEYAVPTLSGTEYGPITSDNSLLATIANKATPTIRQQKERNQEDVDRFTNIAHASIDEQLANDRFVPPKDNETLVLALSDIHSNLAAIETYQYLVDRINQKYGEGTMQLSVLVGDQTYGSAIEKRSVNEISEISDDIYAISGNHDGKLIKKWSESNGVNMLNGTTKQTTNAINILGAPDPSLTKPSALLNVSDDKNVSRSKAAGSQEELGQQLYTEAEATDPTFVLSHEAYALGPFIGKDDISRDTMATWLNKNTDLSADVPAGAVLYGHWHREFDYRVIRDQQGSGTVIAELGSAGGASSRVSPSSLSTPWTTPAQKASVVVFHVDPERQLVTGIQEITTATSGSVVFEPLDAIDQPDPSDSIVEAHQPKSES